MNNKTSSIAIINGIIFDLSLIWQISFNKNEYNSLYVNGAIIPYTQEKHYRKLLKRFYKYRNEQERGTDENRTRNQR